MIDPTWTPTPINSRLQATPLPLDANLPHPKMRTVNVLWALFRLGTTLFSLALIGQLTWRKAARACCGTFQDLGLLWVKLGQLMATRADLFPLPFCNIMGELRNQVRGFPISLAQRTVEAELGHPLEALFSHFEMHPIAGASIAQVHRAKLKACGSDVAVKIRRPGIESAFSHDIGILKVLGQLLTKMGIAPHFRWNDMVWEIEQMVREELDYRYEATSHRRLGKKLARHGILVPQLFEHLCTREVLVMEFVPGITLEAYTSMKDKDPAALAHWEKENGIDPEVVGKALLESYLRQVVEDNLFHSDMHPANVMLLRDNRIAVLDFGSIGNLEGDSHRKYTLFLDSLGKDSFAKAIDIFLLIMPELPSRNLGTLKEELLRRTQSWAGRCHVENISYESKSASMLMAEMTRVLGKQGVVIYWPFFKLLRGWSTLDANLRYMAPNANLPESLRAFQESARKRLLLQTARRLPTSMLQLQKLIDWPHDYYEQAIYRGATVRRLAQVFEGTTTRFTSLLANLCRLAAGLSFLLFALSVLGLMRQTGWWGHPIAEQGPVAVMLAHTRTFDLQIWVLLLLVSGNTWLSLWGLARQLARPEDLDSGSA